MKKQYIFNKQSTIWGESECIGFGTDKFYVKEIERNLANKIIKQNHYSKKIYNGTYIHLGVFHDNVLKGVLQYGYAMNPASCGSVVKGTEKKEYLELNRMWIHDNCIEYAESQAISYSIKYIKRKFKKIKWIQSFADERCGGFGIVYQACSFDYFGEHISSFWELDGETFHNSIKTSEKAGKRGYNLLNDEKNKNRIKHYKLRQFRYIKFLFNNQKKNCLLKQKPYPKHYKELISEQKTR